MANQQTDTPAALLNQVVHNILLLCEMKGIVLSGEPLTPQEMASALIGVRAGEDKSGNRVSIYYDGKPGPDGKPVGFVLRTWNAADEVLPVSSPLILN